MLFRSVDVLGVLQPIRIRFDLLLFHLHFDYDFADDLLPLHDRRGEAVGEIGGQQAEADEAFRFHEAVGGDAEDAGRAIAQAEGGT